MSSHTSQFGSFINYRLWKEAKNLLDFQINQIDKNKHYNTFSMFYYRNLDLNRNKYDTEEFFDQKISNNLFYALSKEFMALRYISPKKGLELRKKVFLTYPSRILYYSVGLYILKLSQEFICEYIQKNKNIESYYGGSLKFTGESLDINKQSTFYLNHYKNFKRAVRKRVQENHSVGTVVLKLDIQNYFENIQIKQLLLNLDKYIKPSIKSSNKFNESTKEQITFYFEYLMNGENGIPQSDNEIISGFIGHLYFSLCDLIIEDQINNFSGEINKYKIIRYVDDVYLFLDIDSQVDMNIVLECITSNICDSLHSQFGLRFNNKTSLYHLADSEQKDDLLRELKKTSYNYPLSNDGDEVSPQKKIDFVFGVLEEIKSKSQAISLKKIESVQEEILKDVYDKAVGQILKKRENQDRINDIFSDFNFDLVKICPREMVLIIISHTESKNKFLEFLKRKNKPHTKDCDLILLFLCQTGFCNSEGLLEVLIKNKNFKEIILLYKNPEQYISNPGYHDLSECQILKLSEKHHIVEQIRLRIMNERKKIYSVALNHLLNEIHAICQTLDSNNSSSFKKDYKADDVVNYLTSRSIPHEDCICIRNLFDRRNSNSVSHHGSEQQVAWGVSQNEYYTYRKAVSECLNVIL